jgi:hypothetical protein
MNTAALGSAGAATLGLVVGAVVLIMLADVAPRFVNGLLALILIGLVLHNSGAYTRVIQSITGQQAKK